MACRIVKYMHSTSSEPVSLHSSEGAFCRAQAFTAHLAGTKEGARPQGSVRFFLVGPITDDLGTMQARSQAAMPLCLSCH